MAIICFLMYVIFTIIVLYCAMQPVVWEIGSAVYLLSTLIIKGLPWFVVLILWAIIIGITLVLELEALRRVISRCIFKNIENSMPKLSKTEEEALNAGDTWLEESIFQGHPDWQRLFEANTSLTEEESAFLEHETETLCSMLNEWEIAQAQDLPESAWQYIKDKGFLGLVIAKEYGGKGFSARAHSDIVIKIASRSSVGAVTVMVPNSLGPGELLQHYGTEAQKVYYLPRLAKGLDIPCFALTEPEAGSDATSIKSEAIVIEHEFEGKKQLGLQLTVDKRWITLAPVATLIGLAVHLKDPQNLLKGVGSEGITCILIPHDTKNLEIGNRHLPANQYFMNGTVRGKDMIVPISSIIGGQERAGQGWQMLVECLSIGRSISLPALGVASSAVSYMSSGAFARVRRQFNVEISQFEGIQEKLAEIAGLSYLINATRLLTVAAVNEHRKPSVASAITKYFNTELARITINDAMDIHAGRAVVMGPRNYMANYYQSIPISVTVEGANIMSRNLLIFGQGSMACHPYVRQEFYALASKDQQAFHHLLWKHIGYFLHNFAKTIGSAWTGGFLIRSPQRPLRREIQQLTRLSYAFAWLADLSLMYLGGTLKRRERLSARLADGMSYLYIAMATIKYVREHSHQQEHLLHAKWAFAYCFYQAQKAMIELCQNFPSRILGVVMRWIAFPWGQSMHSPSDHLSHRLAQLMIQNNAYRNNLRHLVYLNGNPAEPLDRMEHALQLLIKHGDLYQKITDLKRVARADLPEKLAEKVRQGELTEQEAATLSTMIEARWDAIQVDEFEFKRDK